MKEIFNKHVNAFLALLAFQILIIIVVVVVTFSDAGGPISALYRLVSKSPGFLGIFNTITDWSAAISGFVVCTALVILLLNLRKHQRDRAIIRLHSWARNGVVVLAQYRQENAEAAEHQSGNFDGVKPVLDKLNHNMNLAMNDARILGGELNDRLKKTFRIMHAIEDKLGNHDKSLFEDLQSLQHDLAGIMIRAFEFFN
jgi:hypothetical protein